MMATAHADCTSVNWVIAYIADLTSAFQKIGLDASGVLTITSGPITRTVFLSKNGPSANMSGRSFGKYA